MQKAQGDLLHHGCLQGMCFSSVGETESLFFIIGILIYIYIYIYIYIDEDIEGEQRTVESE
jgi:hypothetical protein